MKLALLITLLFAFNPMHSQNYELIDEYYKTILMEEVDEIDRFSIKLNIENRWEEKTYHCQTNKQTYIDYRIEIKENGVALLSYFDINEDEEITRKKYYFHSEKEIIEITEYPNDGCASSVVRRYNENKLLFQVIEKECDGSEITEDYIYSERNDLIEIVNGKNITRPTKCEKRKTIFEYSNSKLKKITHFDLTGSVYSAGVFLYDSIGILSNIEFYVKGVLSVSVEYQYDYERKLIRKIVLKKPDYSSIMVQNHSDHLTQKETYDYEYYEDGQLKSECWKQYIDYTSPREKEYLELLRNEAPDGVICKVITIYDEQGLLESESSNCLGRNSIDKGVTRVTENCWCKFKMKKEK